MRPPLDSVPGGPNVISPRITRGLEPVNVEGTRGIWAAEEVVNWEIWREKDVSRLVAVLELTIGSDLRLRSMEKKQMGRHK